MRPIRLAGLAAAGLRAAESADEACALFAPHRTGSDDGGVRARLPSRRSCHPFQEGRDERSHMPAAAGLAMRKAELERALEAIPRHPSPRPEWEQYRTPPAIAADLL